MPGPDAAGHHQRRQHRAELLDHRRADEPADHGAGAELIERQAGLQRQHHAGERAGQQHDRQRSDADRVELLDDVAARRSAGVTRPRADLADAAAGTPGPRARRA